MRLSVTANPSSAAYTFCTNPKPTLPTCANTRLAFSVAVLAVRTQKQTSAIHGAVAVLVKQAATLDLRSIGEIVSARPQTFMVFATVAV